MKTVKKVSAVEQAIEEIKKYIREDSTQIGDQLPTESDFCEQLEVGRGTVREALRVLTDQGYIDVHAGKGRFLKSKEPTNINSSSGWFREHSADLQQLTAFRLAVEPYACKIAIENSTDELTAQLRAIHERSVEAVKADDIETIGKCDKEFHELIFYISGNTYMIKSNEWVSTLLEPFRKNTFTIRHNVDNFIPAHEAIVRAFEDHDAKAGERSMQQHIEKVMIDLIASRS